MVRLVADRAAALALGITYDQRTVYDFAAGKDVATGLPPRR